MFGTINYRARTHQIFKRNSCKLRLHMLRNFIPSPRYLSYKMDEEICNVSFSDAIPLLT
uniref:Uncharacterized protein n=1 Tax=Octopus bimaculoides TaxID=37653 RepID=A0A0L8GL02_OCTBM